jgi:hypothetical protein
MGLHKAEVGTSKMVTLYRLPGVRPLFLIPVLCRSRARSAPSRALACSSSVRTTSTQLFAVTPFPAGDSQATET